MQVANFLYSIEKFSQNTNNTYNCNFYNSRAIKSNSKNCKKTEKKNNNNLTHASNLNCFIEKKAHKI